jgi:hypothetical protein
MGFTPDIIVTGPDGLDIALVAGVKTSPTGLDEWERQLKKYMAGMHASVGLLVTPERLWLYKDQYLSRSEDSIVRAGEFNVRDLLSFENCGARSRDAAVFEQAVQSWLEGLSTESGLRELSPELRAATKMYIVPAISDGTIRAGHPRPSLTAY